MRVRRAREACSYTSRDLLPPVCKARMLPASSHKKNAGQRKYEINLFFSFPLLSSYLLLRRISSLVGDVVGVRSVGGGCGYGSKGCDVRYGCGVYMGCGCGCWGTTTPPTLLTSIPTSHTPHPYPHPIPHIHTHIPSPHPIPTSTPPHPHAHIHTPILNEHLLFSCVFYHFFGYSFFIIISNTFFTPVLNVDTYYFPFIIFWGIPFLC
jgi:hypothetical protein